METKLYFCPKYIELMKTKLFYVLFCTFFTLFAHAQQSIKNDTVYREIPVYRDVDVMAKYRGGYQVLLKQIEDGTRKCKRGSMKGKDATLLIDVLVTDKGKVAKVDFVKADVSICNDAIKQIVEQSNQWIPAKIGNKPVNSYLQLTINLNNGHDSSGKTVLQRLQ